MRRVPQAKYDALLRENAQQRKQLAELTLQIADLAKGVATANDRIAELLAAPEVLRISVKKRRRTHPPEFKAKVGLEAVKGVKTANEIAQEYGVHLVLVGQWKKAILERAAVVFEGKRGPKPVAEHREPEKLFSEIGKLKMELDCPQRLTTRQKPSHHQSVNIRRR